MFLWVVGGGLKVHVCLLKVGGLSKKGKDLSTWFELTPGGEILN